MCVSKCVLYLNILFFIPSSKSQLLRFCSFSVPVNINFHTHKFCLQTAHGYRHSCYFHYYFISFGDYSLVSAIPCSLSSAFLYNFSPTPKGIVYPFLLLPWISPIPSGRPSNLCFFFKPTSIFLQGKSHYTWLFF